MKRFFCTTLLITSSSFWAINTFSHAQTPAPFPDSPPAQTTNGPVNLLQTAPVAAKSDETGFSSDRLVSPTLDLSSLWGKTPLSLLQITLHSLPERPSSPAAHILQRSLLLAPTARPREKSDPMLAVRIERLLMMGETENAQALLSSIPETAMTPYINRLRIDLALLGVTPEKACTYLPDSLPTQEDDFYIQKIAVFCDILAGKLPQANATLETMRVQGLDDDVFIAATENMIQMRETQISSLPQPTPLHLALLRIARIPIPTDAIQTSKPVILRGIALSPNAPQEMRLLAAEKAEASGALPMDSLRQLYQSVTIPKQELSLATAKKAAGTARGRAILYQLAATQSQPNAKIAVIEQALSDVQTPQEYLRTLRLYAAQITQIKPSATLVTFASTAFRSLIADNRSGDAAVWLGILRQQAATNDEAARLLTAIWPLSRLGNVSGSIPWAAGSLSAWNTASAPANADEATLRSRLILATTLLATVDDTIPPEDLVFLLEQQGPLPTSNAPLSSQAALASLNMGRAIRDERRGEVVLWIVMILDAMQAEKPLPVPLLQQVILALKHVGLEASARTIAIDSALLAGL